MTPSRPGLGPVAALALTLLALSAPAPGGGARAGTTTGFAFLDLPAGARQAALGGTGVASAEGPLALFWNPAGLAPAAGAARAGGRVVADHNEGILSFRQDLVGGQIVRGATSIGLALDAHYTQAIDQRDALGNLVGSFGATDMAAALGFAGQAAPGLRLGGSLNWVREDLAGNTAAALGVSAGGIYEVAGVRGLSLGASVRNLGKSPAFKTETGADGAPVEQPLTLSAGATYGGHVGHVAFRAAADAVKLRGDSGEGRLGLEVDPSATLALRGGWMLGQDAADLTAGLGVVVGRIRVDYAFVPYHQDLGNSHRAAIEATF